MDAIKINHKSLNLPSKVLLASNSIYFACPQGVFMKLKTIFFVISLSKSLDNYSSILQPRFLFFYLKTTFFFDYFVEYYFWNLNFFSSFKSSKAFKSREPKTKSHRILGFSFSISSDLYKLTNEIFPF